jgi:hypothetical protein
MWWDGYLLEGVAAGLMVGSAIVRDAGGWGGIDFSLSPSAPEHL